MSTEVMPLPRSAALAKACLDRSTALLGLMLSGWLILLLWLAASIDTRSNGFFTQTRIGLNGRPFRIIKIKTMRPVQGLSTSVTTARDQRITRLGALLRRLKLDELPQLWNVLIGDMSLVGPRPEVPEYAALLTGEDRIILTIRPGITGPATIEFRNEEALLAEQCDPERYNREVIYPQKIAINKRYIKDYTFTGDLNCILKTLTG